MHYVENAPVATLVSLSLEASAYVCVHLEEMRAYVCVHLEEMWPQRTRRFDARDELVDVCLFHRERCSLCPRWVLHSASARAPPLYPATRIAAEVSSSSIESGLGKRTEHGALCRRQQEAQQDACVCTES
jgi:hypothetical protein